VVDVQWIGSGFSIIVDCCWITGGCPVDWWWMSGGLVGGCLVDWWWMSGGLAVDSQL